jgi:hypothetical protein
MVFLDQEFYLSLGKKSANILRYLRRPFVPGTLLSNLNPTAWSCMEPQAFLTEPCLYSFRSTLLRGKAKILIVSLQNTELPWYSSWSMIPDPVVP